MKPPAPTHSDVRFWHLSDLPILAANVAYEGSSGSGSDIAKPARLTRS
jgi:hypothetical protein